MNTETGDDYHDIFASQADNDDSGKWVYIYRGLTGFPKRLKHRSATLSQPPGPALTHLPFLS